MILIHVLHVVIILALVMGEYIGAIAATSFSTGTRSSPPHTVASPQPPDMAVQQDSSVKGGSTAERLGPWTYSESVMLHGGSFLTSITMMLVAAILLWEALEELR